MSEAFIGEITIFAGNFAPDGWAFCDGSLLPIRGNEPLFSLIGTTYGGDGRNNFALPNLQGRVPIHMGQAPGLTAKPLGQTGGAETVTLMPTQLPAHTHPLVATQGAATSSSPSNMQLAQTAQPMYATNTPVDFHAQSISTVGGAQAHENRQPSLVLNFIICLTGLYPSRP